MERSRRDVRERERGGGWVTWFEAKPDPSDPKEVYAIGFTEGRLTSETGFLRLRGGSVFLVGGHFCPHLVYPFCLLLS